MSGIRTAIGNNASETKQRQQTTFTEDDDDGDEEWSSYPELLKALDLSCLYFSS